jgi:hypothetical protein
MRIKALAIGTLTFVPGLSVVYNRFISTGGTDSARYCYTVWLRHLAMARSNGLCDGVPRRVAELGPGDSLGIGIAALLSGAERYTGLDIMQLSKQERNLAIFDELVTLFRQRVPIPGPDEFPDVKPPLPSYEFPSGVTPQLDEQRLDLIRRSIMNPNVGDSLIRYAAPWHRSDVIDRGSVDMMFSQAVLEHVDDLVEAYSAMHSWLATGGFISHQIDFRCHGLTREWNGHWATSDLTWKVARGRRPFLINRQPHSVHLTRIRAAGFDIVCDKTASKPSKLDRRQLSPRFANCTLEDLTTSGAFIQARVSEEARTHAERIPTPDSMPPARQRA